MMTITERDFPRPEVPPVQEDELRKWRQRPPPKPHRTLTAWVLVAAGVLVLARILVLVVDTLG